MEQPNRPKDDRKYYLFALKIAGDFGVAIAAPAVVAALLGNWLDGKYSTYPLFLILCLLVAGLLTAKSIHRKAKRYGEQYNKM